MATERRSTRIGNLPALQVPQAISTLDGHDTDAASPSSSEFDTTDSDAHIAKKKKVAGSKRKYKGTSSTNQQLMKKPRGKQGLLKDVVELPLDIVHEIFGHLMPLDLLNLARTSKELRKMLMDRSSAFIWRSARANDPYGLPDCPSNMSEPAYASLCYDKFCMKCDCASFSPNHAFALGLRLCRKCVDQQFKGLPRHLRNESIWGKVINILPRISYTSSYQVFYRPSLEELQTTIVKLDGLHEGNRAVVAAELLKHKFGKQLLKKHKHAMDCEKWLNSRNKDIQSERDSVLQARRSEVIDFAKTLAWPLDLFDFKETVKKIEDCKAITKVCGKKITPQALEALKDTLNDVLKEANKGYVHSKVSEKLNKWLPLLDNLRDECKKSLHPHTPVISTRDLFHLPMVHSRIMDSSLDSDPAEVLDPIRPLFSAFAVGWESGQKLALLQMVDSAYGADPLSELIHEDVIFNLATTLFSCSAKGCRCMSFRFPQVLFHPCALQYHEPATKPATEPEDDISVEEGAEAEVAASILRQQRWNSSEHISFNRSLSAAMGSVVKLCGFDPLVATVAELEAANPILECISCNDIHKGRTTMSWERTVHHYKAHHANTDTGGSTRSMILNILDEPDASFVRSQLKIQKEKVFSAKDSARCVCVECHLEGNIPKLKAHWRATHGRPATDADIVPILGMPDCLVNEEFMLWPPRELDTLAAALASGTRILVPTL